MKIYIGADHRGFKMKEAIKLWLSAKNFDITDCGNSVFDQNDDFPDFSIAVAKNVANSLNETMQTGDSNFPEALGIVICGSGGGVTISANKVKGIRCAQGVNVSDVIHNRNHDNINILAIGSDFISESEAKAMVEAFIKTPFSGEIRFLRRLKKITDLESM